MSLPHHTPEFDSISALVRSREYRPGTTPKQFFFFSILPYELQAEIYTHALPAPLPLMTVEAVIGPGAQKHCRDLIFTSPHKPCPLLRTSRLSREICLKWDAKRTDLTGILKTGRPTKMAGRETRKLRYDITKPLYIANYPMLLTKIRSSYRRNCDWMLRGERLILPVETLDMLGEKRMLSETVNQMLSHVVGLKKVEFAFCRWLKECEVRRYAWILHDLELWMRPTEVEMSLVMLQKKEVGYEVDWKFWTRNREPYFLLIGNELVEVENEGEDEI